MRKISISSNFSCMKVDEYLHMFIGCYVDLFLPTEIWNDISWLL